MSTIYKAISEAGNSHNTFDLLIEAYYELGWIEATWDSVQYVENKPYSNCELTEFLDTYRNQELPSIPEYDKTSKPHAKKVLEKNGIKKVLVWLDRKTAVLDLKPATPTDWKTRLTDCDNLIKATEQEIEQANSKMVLGLLKPILTELEQAKVFLEEQTNAD